MQRVIFWLCCALMAASAAAEPLTVLDAVRTARILCDPLSVDSANPQGVVSISPDRSRYVARIARADTDRNGVWVEIIAGSLSSAAAAADYRSVTRLFTTGLDSQNDVVGPSSDLVGYASPIRWIDNDRILFLFSDEHGVRQLHRVTLSTGRVELLTRHSTHVVAYDVGPDGAILYNARAPQAAPSGGNDASLIDGIILDEGITPLNLFHGQLAGTGDVMASAWTTQWFVQKAGRPPRQLNIAGRERVVDFRHRIHLSPDGKRAIINTQAAVIPKEWDRYTEPFLRQLIQQARDDAQRRGLTKNVHQLYIVDMDSGASRVLWNAPSDIYIPRIAWSPDSLSILVAPTYLPAEAADETALAGRAAAVVNVDTGAYVQLPVDLPTQSVRQIGEVAWRTGDEVVIVEREADTLKEHRFKRTRGEWKRVARESTVSAKLASKLSVVMRENLNVPPRLVAIESATGEEHLILDPNPALTHRFSLGRVERFDRPFQGGARLAGLLFYPPHHERGRRYPLVIQSAYGSPPNSSFTLYGPQDADGAIGPARSAVYAGRLLADRNIVVLHLNVTGASHTTDTPMEGETRRLAFESAVTALTERGLIDPSRVGLLGFSRNGYYVEYTLTHSALPFAAAIAADNYDPSYVATVLTGQGRTTAGHNGGPPFGATLQDWLKHAPAFNADKVRTPLRKVVQSGGLFEVLTAWEMYSRLRELNKPVEMYLIPNHERGSHLTQNPAQVIALQQGSVDWFDFWLNGYEDPAPKKQNMYHRWRQLRELQRQSSMISAR